MAQVDTMTAAEQRRERGRQEMRRQILDAAREVVVSEGIGALSMRGVARAIGYSAAALYEYFPSKEDVLQALYFEGTGGLTERTRAALASLPPDATTRDAFRLLGHAYRDAAHAQPELYRFAFGGAGGDFAPNEANRAGARECFEVLVDAARRGVATGDFIDLDPHVIAIAAWAGVHGFVSLELDGKLLHGPELDAMSEEERAGLLDKLFDSTLLVLGLGMLKR